MLGGKGFYRGSSVLVSGTAGTGKTSLAAHFADAACRRGRALPLLRASRSRRQQIVRNMRSIGLDLEPLGRAAGCCSSTPAGPTLYGLEMHLATIYRAVQRLRARSVVIIDPLSNLSSIGSLQRGQGDAAAAGRLPEGAADHGAVHQPDLERRPAENETHLGVSSLMDTWLLLRNLESNGERNRGLYVLKSRGMAPLEPDPRVPADRPGGGAGGRLPGRGRGADRLGAARPGGAGAGRAALTQQEELAALQRRLDRRRPPSRRRSPRCAPSSSPRRRSSEAGRSRRCRRAKS